MSRVRRLLPLLPLLALAALLAIPAIALAAHVIDTKTASGDYATTVAAGNADKPKALYVKIVSKPAQHVTGNWTLVCSKGVGAGSKSGRISGTGTFQRRLKMNTSHPDSCTVSAAAQLSKSGRLRITLLAG